MTTTDSTIPRAASAMTARRASSSVPIALRAVQLLLLVPLGAFLILASIYFGFIESPRPPQAIDWIVGAWAFTIGAGNLVVGARLGRGARATHRAALVLVANHLVFEIIKVVGYGEPEAATFIVGDLLALALLLSPSVRGFLKR